MTTPPDPRDIEQEAAYWLAQLSGPQLSREQFLRFLAWYQVPENHAVLQRLLGDSLGEEDR